MDRTELYRDIAERTNGDIYIGVVGPVRTGKSTFIKRFMDLLVLPGMEDPHAKERLTDELPQSAAGRTIMTTQPKFVPNEAAQLKISDTMSIRVRMVDCVGYMVPGAVGHIENDMPRMVRTPWHDHDIPFEEAAEIGTRKVITEHSTIGVVLTTDGSITQIEREDYVEAEERVVQELKEQGKPFVIVLNSTHPNDAETLALAMAMQEKYDATVRAADVMQMSAAEFYDLMELVLMEFPIRMVHIALPEWISALAPDHWLVQRIMEPVYAASDQLTRMRDYDKLTESLHGIEGFDEPVIKRIALGSGEIEIDLRPQSSLFYTVLGEACGYEIRDDAHLIASIKEFVAAKREYDRLRGALDAAYRTGYGMVPPAMDEMALDEPEIMQQGSRFGVRLHAKATGLHMIRIDIDSEVAPLVGTEEQAEEFLAYLLEAAKKDPNGMWSTNIFGKPLYDLVKEGMTGKVNRLPDGVQQRLQETLQRMVNEGCNGLICILL